MYQLFFLSYFKREFDNLVCILVTLHVHFNTMQGAAGGQAGQPGVHLRQRQQHRAHIQLVNRPHQEQVVQQQQRIQQQREQGEFRPLSVCYVIACPH